MRAKLGLVAERDEDAELVRELFRLLEGQQADFTMTFRALGTSLEHGFAALGEQVLEPDKLAPWFAKWQARLSEEPADPAVRRLAMDKVNPLHIPRNHLLDAALADAEAGDLAPFEAMLRPIP